MRFLTVAAFAVGVVCQPLGAAGQSPGSTSQQVSAPVVVELYTSQGCSSCPPADEVLQALAQRDDVLALALHVDYWDYIGWKDEFASPAHTQRQKAYARARGRRMIYTPQMIIMGYEDVVGANEAAVAEVISAYQLTPQPVALKASRDGNEVTISAVAVQHVANDTPLVLHLARYTPLQSVDIKRGELRGHSLDYANVVAQLDIVGEWDGNGEYSVTIPVEGPQKTAFFVQQGSSGRIVGALKLD